MSEYNLQDKTILVTGASSGIGQSLAKFLSTCGAKLVITGRDEQRLLNTFSSLRGEGHLKFALDLTDNNSLDTFADSLPMLNGVVFNAGGVQYDMLKFITPEKIDNIFNINFKANALLTQKLLKKKKLLKQASLVYISSISSKLGVPGTALYAASKAALVAFAKVVASEVAIQGIRSNCICPGIVKTPMTLSSNEAASAEGMSEAEKEYPLGYGAPEDIEGVVSFLLSDHSKWMTGSDIIIDGGFTLK